MVERKKLNENERSDTVEAKNDEEEWKWRKPTKKSLLKVHQKRVLKFITSINLVNGTYSDIL